MKKYDLEEVFEQINSKLSALISLSLRDKNISLRESIMILSKTGINNHEIARILNISSIHVAKEKSVMKKKNG